MRIEQKEILLKNGQSAVLRTPVREDAGKMLSFLKNCASETDFLLRYPEEYKETLQQEEDFLEKLCRSEYALMVICEAEGNIAGSCQLQLNRLMKTRHRAEAAIGILRAYWNLGIGTGMFETIISAAKEKGILQIELDYVEGNDRAAAFYKKLGFEQTGVKPNAIRLKNGEFLREIAMVKQL